MSLTRQAILKVKASARGVEVPEVVLTYIAEHLRASIRELEGALYTVIAQADLTGRRLDLGLAQSALRDSIRHTTVSIGLQGHRTGNLQPLSGQSRGTQIGQPHPGAGVPSYDRHVHVPQACWSGLQRDRSPLWWAQPHDRHGRRTESREMAPIREANHLASWL